MIATWLDGAQPHLLVNHLPVILAPCALALLLAGAWFRSAHLERAGMVACIVVALTAIGADWTGEPAEDAVRGLPGVAGPSVEAHEQAASPALASALLLGVAAIVSLVLSVRKGAAPTLALAATALLAAVTVAALARTAWLGGQIRHSEIRDADRASAGAQESR